MVAVMVPVVYFRYTGTTRKNRSTQKHEKEETSEKNHVVNIGRRGDGRQCPFPTGQHFKWPPIAECHGKCSPRRQHQPRTGHLHGNKGLYIGRKCARNVLFKEEWNLFGAYNCQSAGYEQQTYSHRQRCLWNCHLPVPERNRDRLSEFDKCGVLEF